MIPTIGDELVYMTIAEKTAASGNWLPLQSEEEMKNTKPPLLFWQGMWTTEGINHPSYWDYRWPGLLITFLIALTLIKYGRRIFSSFEVGISAALIYLCFFSTFQYGRHFLMHPHEALLMNLPLLRYVYNRKLNFSLMLFSGLCFGLVALLKSFVFAFLGVAILAILILVDNEFKIDFKFALKNSLKLLVSLAFALSIFSIWFLLDPDPQAIWDHFVLKENMGKVSGSFWEGLKAYPVTNIWLGVFSNAGLLAPIVLGTFWSFKSFKANIFEKMLLVIMLSYVVFFTFPSQRQSNYILPIMIPLALLMANRWHLIASSMKRITFSLYWLLSLVSLVLVIAYHYWGEKIHSEWLPFLLIANCFWCFIHFIFARGAGPGRLALVTGVFYFCINLFVVPFSTPWSVEEVLAWHEPALYVPVNFRNKEKRFKIMAPGIEIKPYELQGELSPDALRLIEEGHLVALVHKNKNWPEEHKLKIYDQKPYLFERHSKEELNEIIFDQKLSNLFGYISIVKKRVPSS